MQKANPPIGLSNCLENLLFPPHKYTAAQLISLMAYFTHGSKFTLPKYRDIMKQMFDIDDEKLWWVVRAQYGQVDAKVLLLVLMLQLVGKERRQVGGFNEGARNGPKDAHGQLTSPRSRNPRMFYLNQEETLILQFIKDNLTIFLRLLSSDSVSPDPYLEAEELQPLSFLFKVDRKKKFALNLSIFGTANKLKASTISEHLKPRLIISEQDLISLEGLSYALTVKDKTHCQGRDIRIISCDDSEIFINSSVRSVYIVDCNNCTIYVAACEHIVFADKCEKINFTISTNLFRICNTHESKMFYYGPAPVILTGDIRSLSIGPNNSSNPELMEHVKSAGIENYPSNITNFTKVLHTKGLNENVFSLMSPAEFDLLVLADSPSDEIKKTKKGKNEQESLVILAPKEYIQELQSRNAYYSSLKTRIIQSNLGAEMTKNLHSSIQGNFKEWLLAKQHVKNLKNLVKMLDKNDIK